MATEDQLPLQVGHPIVDPRTGLLTPPWVIFFQHLIRQMGTALHGPIDLGGGSSVIIGVLPWEHFVPAGYWTPITNGDPLSPEILFEAETGDCVVGFVPTPE